MGFLRFVLWTACAMGLGVVMATVVVDGRTPLEHMKGAWSTHVARPGHVDEVKTRVNEALEDARDALAEDAEEKPRERHSERDREAVKQILARQK